MRASCNPSIAPQGSVRFHCRSGFWASNVDLGKTGMHLWPSPQYKQSFSFVVWPFIPTKLLENSFQCENFQNTWLYYLHLHGKQFCFFLACPSCVWDLFMRPFHLRQQWMDYWPNQSSASFSLFSRTFHMRLDKCTSSLPRYWGREASGGIFLHFNNFIEWCTLLIWPAFDITWQPAIMVGCGKGYFKIVFGVYRVFFKLETEKNVF